MRLAAAAYRARCLATLACALLLGCSGRSGGGQSVVSPPPVTPSFRCSDSVVAQDTVAMKCLTQLAADVWQLEVRIGSPTTAKDIGGFAFDVLFDPTLLQYVTNSARAGPMLYQESDTPLLYAAIDPADAGRLVVGIYRTGGAPGVQGVAGYDQILIFDMRLVPGAQFDPDPAHFRFDLGRSEALDSSVTQQPISTITFSDQLLLSDR